MNTLLSLCKRRSLLNLTFKGLSSEKAASVSKKVESEFLPLYTNYGMGLTTWSPLASGVLTGKYTKGSIPPDSRFALENYKEESEGKEEEVKKGKGGDEFYEEDGSGEYSDKMRCPQLERGFEDLAFPTSRQLTPHELYRRGPSTMNIAHAGVAIFTLGVILSSSMKTQFTQRLPLGSELNLGKERIILRGLDHLYGPTYHSICGNLMIYKPTPTNSLMTNLEHNESANLLPINFPVSDKLEHFLHRWIKNHEQQHFGLTMFPEKRFYQQGMTTTEVAIHTNLLTDFYALIGTGSCSTGGWYVTIMKLPFIFLVFIGFAVGAAGGFLRLFRLLRLKKLRW